MRMQDSQAGCGPASMSNALSAMGIRRTIPECEALCKTTGTAGTSPKRLFKACHTVEGVSPGLLMEIRPEVALLRLEGSLRRGRSMLLCVDKYDHWIAAIGMLGERVLVADPADNDLVLSLQPGELLERWAGDGKFRFYGIIL